MVINMPKENRNEVIQLVQAIEKHPILYDSNTPKCNSRIAQKDAWNKVALEVNDNPSSCKEKWQSVRSSLVRYMKSDSKRYFYLLEHLQFLLPYLKLRESPKNTSVDEVTEDISDDHSDSPSRIERSMKDEHSYSTKYRSESELEDSERNSKRKAEDSSLYEEEQKRKCRFCDEENSDTLFFKSVLSDVRKMTMSQKLQFRIHVLNSLGKVLHGDSEVRENRKRRTLS